MTGAVLGRVVVGADGSDQAHDALQWGAEHALRVGSVLRIVHAVVLPTMGGLAWHSDAALQADRLLRALDEEGHLVVGRAVGQVQHDHPGLVVESTCTTGDPRDVLLADTRPTDLVVVGSRGRGPVRSLLLGSVSAAVARHSGCPTVVHRPPGDASRGVVTTSDPAAVTFAEEYAGAHGCEVSQLSDPDVDALVAAGEDAELLVLARRHHRAPAAFDRAVAVAEHAPCPVAVVPAPDPTPAT